MEEKKGNMKITQEEFEERIGFFSIKEFCATGEIPNVEIAESIIENHINLLNPIRKALGEPIFVSKNSGYRPKEYELSKGRSGRSQHTFEDVDGNVTKGAVDLTSSLIVSLGELLKKNSKYTRICYYPNNGFYHCDYKKTLEDKRQYFECKSPYDRWVFQKHL